MRRSVYFFCGTLYLAIGKVLLGDLLAENYCENLAMELLQAQGISKSMPLSDRGLLLLFSRRHALPSGSLLAGREPIMDDPGTADFGGELE
jgi:hypothetical protein